MGAGMGHKERYGNQVCWEEPPPLCWEREIQSIWGHLRYKTDTQDGAGSWEYMGVTLAGNSGAGDRETESGHFL